MEMQTRVQDQDPNRRIAELEQELAEARQQLRAVRADITDRKSSEEELARINRALKMLSACHESLLRTEHECALLEEICCIVVEMGGYRMAWVGFAENDETCSISLQAHAGAEAAYLREGEITWDENTPAGRGPAGVAIRTGEATVCEDASALAETLPWRADALRCGYRGIICLPLRDAARTFGLLGLYSAEVKPASAEELKLLQNMANDLAFGIVSLRARIEQRRLQAVVLKVAAGVSASTGAEFFVQLARNMAEALGAQAGFVTQLISGEPLTARTLAAVVRGEVVANFGYPICGTPCESLLTSETWAIEKDVAGRLLHVPALGHGKAESYVGQRLSNSKGEPLGHLSVIFGEPLKDVAFIDSTLRIFAARAAAELERQQTDDEVRKQAALLDIAHEAIYAEDMEGRVIYWNKGAEQTYGWSAREVMGRISAEMLRPNAAELMIARAALEAHGEWNGETIKHTKEGREIVVEVGWTLVRDSHGQPRSVLAIDTDITERKYAEEALARSRENVRANLEQRVARRTRDLVAATQEAERANRAKSEFLSRMSHELRTPLHAILGFAHLLEQDRQSAEDAYGVAQIVRAGNHLLELINEVLDLSRVEAGKLEITLEPVNVRVALLESLSLVKTQAAERGVRLEPLTGHLDCEVLSSAQRLRQVMVNLLSNGVKFNHTGGSVLVACERRGEALRIEVSDTGCGISVENQQRLFTPFERLEVESARVEGAGLGLSISKHLVEAMQGRIGVKSAPGHGATFWIELPLSEKSSAATALHHDSLFPGEEEEEPPRRALSRTVLCIEDNLSNLRLIERILARRQEVKLISAMQGDAGLAMARQAQPDVILLDLHLPDLGGEEVLRQLRADPRTARIPVVIISADATPAQVERLRAAGAHEYLTKPINMRRFLALIDAVPSMCGRAVG